MNNSFHFSEADYQFSYLLDHDEVQENRAFTLLPVRRNKNHKDVDQVALDLVKTWTELVADGTTDGFHGTENGISGNFDSLIIPEAKPDRLGHSVWWTQFFFILDDKAEALAREIAHTKLNVEVANILADAGKKQPTSALGRVLVPGIRDLLAVDYERGIPILEAWRYWVLNTDSKALSDFETLDDYIKFRIINTGMLYVIPLPV